ncbi:chromate transporter [uncultured Clostridium sp.]|uniref:chromate transporter n=1 Tax=uncultured Clostridium sp. TaxID=59620 RepID=UPI0028E68A3C|nr:chromate transporter [uncultured Clostridium sp.]
MIYLTLFYEFFKIGLFAVGGGLATLPFLTALTFKYDWFSQSNLADMIAVSESTPGPMGVNMATYAGFHSSGILGSIVATLGLIIPSIIIIIIVANFLERFKESRYVKAVFYGLRAAVVGLIAAAGFEVLKISLFNFNQYNLSNKVIQLINIKAVVLCTILLYLSNKCKRHPVFYIGIGAIFGIIFKL